MKYLSPKSLRKKPLKNEVGALVTSYNDPEALERCITSLINQSVSLDYILIIENSEENLAAEIINKPSNRGKVKIEVFKPNENIGLSGSIRYAYEWSEKRGLHYLWIFDQDSVAEPDALNVLLSEYQLFNLNKKESIWAICAVGLDRGLNQSLLGYNYNGYRLEEITQAPDTDKFVCDGQITSGTLLILDQVSIDLLPDTRLFIDGVDHDMCYKAMSLGRKVLIAKKARFSHHMGNRSLGLNIISKTKYWVPNYSPLRKYYITRNHSYLELRAARNYYKMIVIFIRLRVGLSMIKDALAEDPKNLSVSVKAIISGTIRGLFGIMKPYQIN